jgi:hypothetical protein
VSDRDFEMVIPTRAGRDLANRDKTKDAHIRIESYKQVGTNIFVDIFDSSIKNASNAHLVSGSFPHSDEGAAEATEFLQKHDFGVVVVIK